MKKYFKKVRDLYVFTDSLVIDGQALTVVRFMRATRIETDLVEVEFILEPDKHYKGLESKVSVEVYTNFNAPFFITQLVEHKARIE